MRGGVTSPSSKKTKRRYMKHKEEQNKPWIIFKHPADEVPVWIRGLMEVRDTVYVEKGKMYVIERKRLEDYYLDI